MTTDIPDLIAGALGVSRGTAYDMMREALAEQEPVAYFNPQVKGGFYWAKPTKITAPITVSVEPMPLYTTPQTQPKRKWVGLTFAEICECENDYLHLFARAIEAKLKEKNYD